MNSKFDKPKETAHQEKQGDLTVYLYNNGEFSAKHERLTRQQADEIIEKWNGPEYPGWIAREIPPYAQNVKMEELEMDYYPPSGTYEYHDTESDTWYNQSGQMLRNPEQYNRYSEGYTPFGDE